MKITKKHKEIVSVILKKVSPEKKDRLKLLAIQNEIIKKIKVPSAKASVGGSGAKNTWLKDTHDIDIYVKFDRSKKSDELSDLLHKCLKKSFSKISRVHGSRDYFQVWYKGYTVEIVPILAIKNPKHAENITDFSFFHVDYINRKTKKKKSLADEIRVAKIFAKANRFYGAESYINGLSGYAIEILVAHYGSFIKFAERASEWKETTVIGNKNSAQKLNWAKKISPLILIDPVQPDRNAAAALSKEQYYHIIKSCKKFLRNPSEIMFEKQPVNVAGLKKIGYLTTISAKPLKAKHDIAGSKALKAFKFILKNLDKFEVVNSFFDYSGDSAVFYIVTKKEKLPSTYKHYGPPVKNKKAVELFKKANKGYQIKIEKDRCYVMKKIKHASLTEHLKDIIAREEVSSRISEISILRC
ncbi:MAG: nucleotidyltransferase domain-containing protein [Nanoarchaeota archaeon]|nr:nucleotidyltransferase domain-containing protein [Nanoarchaeota archaeon]